MKKVKIVVGANFGDEGKGLMTDYFAAEAVKNGERALVVCHNGGAQRGHTVVLPNGVRHVYHHVGSGYGIGVDTYLDKNFVINPIVFNREMKELDRKFGKNAAKIYVDKKCRMTTPIDMIINQIVEESRGADKHGSCGLGIFETIKRHDEEFLFTISDAMWLTGSLYDKLITLFEKYLPKRLEELGITSLPLKWIEILQNTPDIIVKYFTDIANMLERIELVDAKVINDYDTIIFEGAQGLLLDQNNTRYFPHLTPSDTGLSYIEYAYESLLDASEVEACFVSRTYLTRHGAGPMPNECTKDEINPTMVDLTNVPNPYQGTLRYGHLDSNFIFRISSETVKKGYLVSLAFTHMNESKINKPAFWLGWHNSYNEPILQKIYTSDGFTRESVKEAEA